MNVQIFRLKWTTQADISLILHKVVSEITEVFASFIKLVVIPKKEKTWADTIDCPDRAVFPLRMVPLPFAYREQVCRECGSDSLIGALISPDADEADPNVFCRKCSWVN
jgi:hypothetical protein